MATCAGNWKGHATLSGCRDNTSEMQYDMIQRGHARRGFVPSSVRLVSIASEPAQSVPFSVSSEEDATLKVAVRITGRHWPANRSRPNELRLPTKMAIFLFS